MYQQGPNKLDMCIYLSGHTSHQALRSSRCSLQPPLPPLCNNIKDTPVKRRPNILLHASPVLRPQHQPRRPPLKRRSSPPNRITDIPLSAQHIDALPKRNILLPARILAEYLLKLLRDKPSFVVVRARVASVFCAMHVLQVYSEERIGEPARCRGIREVDVDDERGDEREDNAETEPVEPNVRVRRPDDAVAVLVKEVAVLLQDGLVRVLFRPVVGEGAVGHFVGRRDVDARGACGRELVG
jgi:hypothetical protein